MHIFCSNVLIFLLTLDTIDILYPAIQIYEIKSKYTKHKAPILTKSQQTTEASEQKICMYHNPNILTVQNYCGESLYPLLLQIILGIGKIAATPVQNTATFPHNQEYCEKKNIILGIKSEK